MQRFFWRIVWCVVPIVLAAVVVTQAAWQYTRGEGGFRLGVDLAGGTILVYEIDPDRITAADAIRPQGAPDDSGSKVDMRELADKLKQRIDPGDQKNVTVRAVGNNRVEIILPTGGAHQSRIEQERWDALLAEVEKKYDVKVDAGRGQIGAVASQVSRSLNTEAWTAALNLLAEKFPKAKEAKLADVKVGRIEELVKLIVEAEGTKDEDVRAAVTEAYKPTSESEIEAFLRTQYTDGGKRRDITAEEVEDIKAKIRQAGFLIFQILANEVDDGPALAAAQDFFKNPDNQEAIAQAARAGKPPPFPASSEFTVHGEPATYRWIELGKSERKSLGLNESAEVDDEKELAEIESDSSISERRKAEMRARIESQKARRRALAVARDRGEAYLDSGYGRTLFYSRPVASRPLREEEQGKKIEYFLLTRSSDQVVVDGQRVTIVARPDQDQQANLAVNFTFNATGGQLFGDLTSKNKPDATFQRHLAIILDGEIMSAPALRAVIRDAGQITGNFTKKEVDRLVSILRSGALPATLRPLPVSENTIGPTLGQDTIVSGTRAVGLSFLAVLVFMMLYYRFAGVVASIALLANLLLTVAFMVFFGAAFTLPGLAGLVLMLGMAVDANILIYERMREERDRGMNLAAAIRNGYSRSLPTILDTHLSSIFTAIILYAVGNDQLKGFGISLTAGLIISLFTSLYMTRLFFDMWLTYRRPQDFGMARLLSKTNINFMAIRNYMFITTAILTVIGVSIFAARGTAGLNVDFIGGTVYGGHLKEARAISSNTPPLGLRQLLAPARQEEMLRDQIASVTQTDELGREFRIAFKDGMEQTVEFPEAPNGEAQRAFESRRRSLDTIKDDGEREKAQAEVNELLTAAKAENEAAIRARASVLPDISVEQIYLTSEPTQGIGTSRFFTVRTSEKAPELVQLSLYRLLREDGQSLLEQTFMHVSKADDGWRLTFSNNSEPGAGEPVAASPGFLRVLLDRKFKGAAPADVGSQDLFDLRGEGKNSEGRFQTMRLDSKLDEAKTKAILDEVAQTFSSRPQPERLETFDPQLAQDTRDKALWAIIASWIAILVYLWFRFGNWTFGLAAVICLIHDLSFTLGVIALCHYLTDGVPWLASGLLIEDFKIDLTTVAALLTLVGYSVNDTIVVFDRIREVRGKNPLLTPEIINTSINQTLSRTILASMTVFLVVIVLYIFGGEGVHLFAFVMVIGVIVGTYSSIYVASPLLLLFGEGKPVEARDRRTQPETAGV